MVHEMAVVRGILKAAGVKCPSGGAFEILKRFPPMKPIHPDEAKVSGPWTVKR